MSDNKRLFLDWIQIDVACTMFANGLAYEISTPDLIVAVARGGMIPATLIARKLGVRRLDIFQCTSYEDGTDKQTNLQVINIPKIRPDEKVLFIDDLVDTGETAKLIKSMYPNALFAALYAKPKGIDHVDFYFERHPQDLWIDFPWER